MFAIVFMPFVLAVIVFAGAMIGGAFIFILDAELIRRRRKKKVDIEENLSSQASVRGKR